MASTAAWAAPTEKPISSRLLRQNECLNEAMRCTDASDTCTAAWAACTAADGSAAAGKADGVDGSGRILSCRMVGRGNERGCRAVGVD